MFANKQKQIESRISLYCKEVIDCLEACRRSFRQYLEDANRDTLREAFIEVHKAESLADDKRREIEVMMYTKAIFPESRGDILGLLETMDRMPNQAESAVRMALTQHVTVPEAYAAQILELVDVCCRSVTATIEAVQMLFTDYTSATVAIGKIDELESEADRMEADIIGRLFSSEMDGIDKLLLRDLVKHIGSISDRAENVGDRLRIVVAKRSL